MIRLLNLIFLFFIYSCTVSPRYTSVSVTNKKSNNSKIKKYKKEQKFDESIKIYTGVSSWYGPNFHGKLTANGEVFDMYSISAAHKTLPLGTYVKVTNLDNDKYVYLTINDRGPYIDGRMLDCSMAAAKKLGFYNNGTANVEVEIINFGDGDYMKRDN